MSPVVRANWMLAVVALLLAGLLWLDSRRDEPHYPPLTPLTADQIDRVVIEAQGQVIEQLRRQAEGWTSESLQARVEDREWLGRLLHIAELPSLQRFPAPDNLAPFGLDRPGYRLKFNDILVEWGGLEPLSQRRYVKVGGTIHLITDGYTHHLHAAGKDDAGTAGG